jgi:pyruvate dehydrogenase E1 component
MYDIDPTETNEWLESLESVVENEGKDRANFILDTLYKYAKSLGVSTPAAINTAYRNTIGLDQQPEFPGDIDLEKKIRSIIRWNALVMVMRANQADSSLGGHISTFASSATLYEVGFNHFFHAAKSKQLSDLVYFQGHASPGIYSRAFLEGRISEQQLENFRREVDQKGISSYPHPYLMSDFWEFPTVSMGLGPLMAIYQAFFIKYLINRGLINYKEQKVWAFLGDGEMDEPESLGAISVAGRENLNNLIFVINCNLQRLDGPVRGNAKIIQELEAMFVGAKWNVLKVVWGSEWDDILEKDKQGLLQQILDEAIDGDYQNCKAKGGAWIRENLFGRHPEVSKLVEHLSDEELGKLRRGGHDPKKIYAAYKNATGQTNQPTVILVKTVKGYGTGAKGESANIAHNVKKLSPEDLKYFRDFFNIPVTDKQLEKLPFYKPKADSKEMQYLLNHRSQLGGSIPNRRTEADVKLEIPELSAFSALLKGSQDREISTTMAYVRILVALCKDKNIGKHVVPIVPDEARTFGMEGMFRQFGIYSSVGQKYEPVDSEQIMYYKEAVNGQILEVGINEGGAHALWIAAATAYSSCNIPMIPFYAFYSMFGFQRTGDLAWASGDIQAKGFLIGATSGRTSLNGEGLQHQDGHSHILAATIPNCISYDPTYGYELAVIIQHGLKRMFKDNDNVWYYITVTNENYYHPAIPEDKQAIEGIIRGLYLLENNTKKAKQKSLTVQLLGSGTILEEVRKAAQLLLEFNIHANVWSATSINELAREGRDVQRYNRLNHTQKSKQCWLEKCLENHDGPVVAATDYMHSYTDQIRSFIKSTFVTLGTDGFGRSDTRDKLRSFFEVDRYYIATTAIYALYKDGAVSKDVVTKAMKKYKIDSNKLNPLYS